MLPILGRLLGKHRLERLAMLPLRATITDAVALYGNPDEAWTSEEFCEAKVYEFSMSEWHGINVWEWNGKIHQILFMSSYADPKRDLAHVLATYSEGKHWHVLTKGYSHRRDDLDRWVWYSAMPLIGVGTLEYIDAKMAAQKESS